MSAQPKTSTFLPFMTMAINRDLCARTLAQRKLPVENCIGTCLFDPTSNKIKAMATKVNKGLEFLIVALPGVGHLPAVGEDEKEAARVFLCGGYESYAKVGFRVGGGGGYLSLLLSFAQREQLRKRNFD